MCGITGWAALRPLGDDDRPILERMVATLFHRGPDEAGMAIHEEAALGMRRLAIIDLAGGSQPIYNEDRSIWTVFNGEIYNYPELKRELTALGHIFVTNSDTEVIVHAYESFGLDFPRRLDGMFAIALHDRRNRRLLLVRDHLGIKPLYYARCRDSLVFGSELKALLAGGTVTRELDLSALGELIAWEYVPGAATLLKAVRKLEPAQLLTFDTTDGTLRQQCYWDIPLPDPAGAAVRPEEWIERVETAVQDSTRRQMISDVPLGAFLSGGVDSSLVVSAMGRAQTFSIGFDDPSYNELGWARQVANHLGVEHRDEVLRPDVLELFGHLMHFLDDPIGDFSIFPTYLVSRLARRHVTVALSGDGGDELFAGYETYLAQGHAARYEMIPRLLRTALIEPLVRALPPQAQKKGLINKGKRFLEGVGHDPALGHARWRLFLSEILRGQLFTPEALAGMGDSGGHITRLMGRAGARGPLDRALYVDVKSYLCDNILTKVDRMSMAVSLESRVPYLSPPVVELAFQVPESLKLRGGVTKWLLKEVACRHVPRSCTHRPKEGFSMPIKNWLNREFRPLVDELLDPGRLRREGIFQPQAVSRLVQEHRANQANHSHILWGLIVFQDWQRRWLHGTSNQEAGA